jgi:archaellum biogenesis protein FlaJ (TadC family)
MLLPTLVGIRLYRRFSDSSFKGLVLGLLAASGVMLLVSTASHVWRML